MRVLLATGLFVALFFSQKAQAQGRFQPGYVVLTRGDTLRGLVQAPTRSTVARGVALRKSPPATDQVFYPVVAVRAVSLTGGKRYMMRKMLPVIFHDTLRLLLEPLVQGRANLYRTGYNLYGNAMTDAYANQLAAVYYYAEAGNNTAYPTLLQEKTFRQNLASLFSECPGAPAVKGQFSEANLVRLVQQFNACPGGLATPRGPQK